MRKNRASLKKRVAVAVVSVSTALPAVAPAVSAFADEADDTAANGEASETEAAGDAELAEEGADLGLGKITEIPTSEDQNDGASDEDEAEADVDAEADTDADVVAEADTDADDDADDDLVDDDMTVEDGILADDDDLEATEKLFSEYPAFGSDAFAEWFAGASDDEIEAWYDAAVLELAVDKATDSVADREEAEVPAFGTDEFQAWLNEASDDEILNWIVGAGYADARAFMDEFFAAEVKAEIPEFGPEFFGWFGTATEDDVKAWHAEHYLGADEGYPTDIESDEFNTWFKEHCLVTVGDEEDPLTYYDYDAIFDWICHVPFETAYEFLQKLASGYDIMTIQAAGELWPDNYGASGDLYQNGTGVQDDPYIIDSVEDLRAFAVSIAQGQNNESTTYYLIKSKTYDLNGSWIPVGGALNESGHGSDQPTAFRGHLACEEGVVIQNFAYKSNNALHITEDLASKIRNQSHTGFFAKLGSGATVTGLEIHTDNNTADSNAQYAGILAGEAEGATIKECVVTGKVKSNCGYIGGLVGYAHGTSASTGTRGCTIENCQALDVAVWTVQEAQNGFCNGYSAVGGIVGYAEHASILDTYVKTNTDSGNHIYGNNAYVGGIVGAMKESDIINSELKSGEVGCNNAFAVGGLLGGYGGGAVQVGRFSGTIVAPTSGQNYSAAFMGVAINGASFTYGVTGDICYLFADDKSKADMGIYGGKPSDAGGAYGTDAHIGFWHPDVDQGYTLVSGSVMTQSAADDYFYEELERGIQNCTKQGRVKNLDTIDHFTCDNKGNAIRGYLLTLSMPMVDNKQAADVTAHVSGNNYRETCTLDHQVAFAPGDEVLVSFSPRSGEKGHYQMDPTAQNNPWYSYTQYMFDDDVTSTGNPDLYFDVYGEEKVKAGMSGLGGTRTFVMPNSDVTVGAQYRASSESVEIIPNQIYFKVVQQRSGKREDPQITYRVTAYDADPYKSSSANVLKDKDTQGTELKDILIATQYSGGRNEDAEDGNNGFTVVPSTRFHLDSLINGDESQTRNLTWQYSNYPFADLQGAATGDNHLVTDLKADTNTTGPTATFTLDLTSDESAIYKAMLAMEAEQKASGYKNPITTSSPIEYNSVITATDKSTSANQDVPASGTLDVTILFEVQDSTYVSLNKENSVQLGVDTINYDVVRTLSGDRKNPKVTYTINGQEPEKSRSELTATFYPDYFTPDSGNGVNWYMTQTGLEKGDAFDPAQDFTDELKGTEVSEHFGTIQDGTVALEGTQDENHKMVTVTLPGIPSGSDLDYEASNATLTNVQLKSWVEQRNQNYTKDLKKVPDDTKTYRTLVKATAHDKNSNSATDTCLVTVTFKTVDKTEIKPTEVKIDKKENIDDYEIYYTFAGDKTSEIIGRDIVQKDTVAKHLVNGVGEKLTATIYPTNDNTKPEFQPYNKEIKWSLAKTENDHTNLNPNDVLSIDSESGQITVRGWGASKDAQSTEYSPWIQKLISEGKLDGTTVTVRVIATSVDNNALVDYKDINVTFKAGTMSADKTTSGLTYNLVLTKNTATSLADTAVTASETWSGNDVQKVSASASGIEEEPLFTVLEGDGSTGKPDSENLLLDAKTQGEIALMSVDADHYFKVNTDAQWIKDIIAGRTGSNVGQKTATIQIQTTSGESKVTVPVTINFRYDGVDMTANTVSELPEGYTASPDVITADTPADTYDTKKADVKDRQITLDVVATQGNYSVNNPGTRKWSYGIAQLGNTTYTSAGVKTNDAVYELSGDIKDYCKVENGYLVPIKGQWDALIDSGNVKDSVSGIVTAKKEADGKTMTDSYKVTINFRYDKAVLESHEETFDVVYTQDSLTNSVKSHWTGDNFIQLKAKISDESGRDVTPKWESSDTSIVTVDQDGRVSVNKDTWIKEIIDNAQKYGEDVHSGTRTVYVTAKHPTTGATADTCKITVNFRYDQDIHDIHDVTYNLVMTQTSRTNNPSVAWSGNDIKKLNSKVFVEPGLNNKPYWASEDAGIVTVDDAGNIEPVVNADWQLEIVRKGNFEGQKKVAIDSTNEAKTIKDSTNVTVNFKYEDVVMSENAKTMDVTLTASGYRSNPSYTITGDKAAISAIMNSARDGETKVVYSSSNAALVGINADGSYSLTLPAGVTVDKDNNLVSNVKDKSVYTLISEGASSFLKEAMKHGYTNANPYISSTTAVLTAASEDGRMADQCNLTIRVKYVDNTYTPSYSSGGGGGSSSGGGGGASGVTRSGTTSAQANSLPTYVLKGGTWVQNANGKWLYTNGRTFTNEWAAVHNPYADPAKGQSTFDWFHFGTDSFMTTGWFTDTDGYTYYLHPISDGTQGRMYTGWNWIDDDGDGIAECYYFETVSNGHRGSLYRSTTTPDGYTVNEKGQWTQNGLVITRAQ